ncbi:MAG: hypothetical protein JRI45_08370 [Deltaproteobacteria bacterium]|nr:hypothetical protein [Deltaproteobacteria bacterium]MBW2069393.1 hypothetical protein [Deltaproteobacteria bacterium]
MGSSTSSLRKQAETIHDRMVMILAEVRQYFERYLDGFLNKGSLPVDIFRLLDKFFSLLDELNKLYLARLKREHGIEPFCKPGCSWCCFQMPGGMSFVEYLYLYEGIWRQRPGNLYLARLLDRSSHFATGGANHGLDCQNKILGEYFAKKCPCPFLNNDAGICELYRYRPIVCRSHYSFSPPRFCRPDQQETWRRQIVNIEQSVMVSQMLLSLDKLLPFRLSQFLVPGLLEFMVNVMGCRPIEWLEG